MSVTAAAARQQEMTLSPGENLFRKRIESGEFFILVEHDAPGSGIAPETAGERLAALDEAVSGCDSGVPMSLAVTDGYGFDDAHRGCEYAGALPEARRNAHLIYLSGRGADFQRMQELLSLCRNQGIANVAAVTGDWRKGAVYTESVRTLRTIGRLHPGEFFPGAVINPYKYRADSQFAQFFKMVKKFNQGAQFAVTQAGWDMRKLQSLKWYLSMRGLEFPLIARLILLTPEVLAKIQQQRLPGIGISPDFETILQSELRFSAKQFESAQWRRLELQVAGCRLLGFSAVQISGIDTPDRIRLASARLSAAMREFTTFEQWAEAYNSYQARAEMAPAPDSFMMFDRLLEQRQLPSDNCFCRDRRATLPTSRADRWRYIAAEQLLSKAGERPSANRWLLKYLLAGCRGCKSCRLPSTLYLCVERCPKHIANGSCGGVRADGSCEAGGECVFMKQVAVAGWLGMPDKLEETYIPASDEIME
ncbi:MAG: methylenetetrahydrofolate reductase C-terminal domain-containing protein [Victivallaceae bacterium]|nr:methylenetetrahydrofolate reductase C-terminal domain-containing protein [Victivallaceae bacterium]